MVAPVTPIPIDLFKFNLYNYDVISFHTFISTIIDDGLYNSLSITGHFNNLLIA